MTPVREFWGVSAILQAAGSDSDIAIFDSVSPTVLKMKSGKQILER